MKMKIIACIAAIGLIGLIASTTSAQVSSNYSLVWYAITNGSSTANSSNFRLQGTIGQPLIQSSDSSNYQVCGGFWRCFQPPGFPLITEKVVYLPVIFK